MKMLDFNAIQQPTWAVKLRGANPIIVNLSVPTVELVDRLTAATPELREVTEKKDGSAIRAVYNLVADIMNCNSDGYTFTAEELRDTYRMTLHDIFQFVAGYFDFIKELQDAKN